MTARPNGSFSVEWTSVGNMLARRGLIPGSVHQVVTYDADFQPNGESYLGVYGWTRNPLIEYYIVDSWGDTRPPAGTSTFMGTVNSDNGTYDIYRVYIMDMLGTNSYYRYWSVRTAKRTTGTITVANHFAAWESLDMNMGELYEVTMLVEGYQNSGTAEIRSLSMTTAP
jgi:endo-1,4-beta-xylanase